MPSRSKRGFYATAIITLICLILFGGFLRFHVVQYLVAYTGHGFAKALPAIDNTNHQNSQTICQSEPIRVLTYNVRYGSDFIERFRKKLGALAPGDYLPWSARYPEIRQRIGSYATDLIGLQETHTDEDIAHIVPLEQYTLLSYHLEEFEYGDAALLFKKNRFDLLDSGQIWLGPTSNLPFSFGFTPFAMVRYVNWVMLREKNHDFTFLFVNTHFDNNSRNTEKSADLFFNRFAKLATLYPMIVVGDFNSKAVSKRYQRLIGSDQIPPLLTNAYDLDVSPKSDEIPHPNQLIDHIFVGGPCKIEVSNWQVDKRTLDTGERLSDHNPVFAQLQFTGRKQ